MPVEFLVKPCGCKSLDGDTWQYCPDHIPFKDPSISYTDMNNVTQGPIPTVADWDMLHINEPQIIKEQNQHGEYTWKIVDMGAHLQSIKNQENISSVPKSASTVELRKKRLNGFQKMCRSYA